MAKPHSISAINIKNPKVPAEGICLNRVFLNKDGTFYLQRDLFSLKTRPFSLKNEPISLKNAAKLLKNAAFSLKKTAFFNGFTSKLNVFVSKPNEKEPNSNVFVGFSLNFALIFSDFEPKLRKKRLKIRKKRQSFVKKSRFT